MSTSRLPSLNWLRVFEAAARYQSFARAAEVLNMSPPAVSQQIRALEDTLGRALFERGPQHVRLTDAGHAFLPEVTDALGRVEQAQRTIFGNPGGAVIVLRASVTFAIGWLAPRLPRFMAEYPSIQIHLLSTIYEDQSANSGADLRVLFGRPPHPDHESHILFGETLYPVASPALARQIREASDLAHHVLLEISGHRAGWRSMLDSWGIIQPAEGRIHFADTTLISLAIAAGGGGVALARAPVTDPQVAGHGLVRCLPDLSVPGVERYVLSIPPAGHRKPAVRILANWIIEEATKDAQAHP